MYNAASRLQFHFFFFFCSQSLLLQIRFRFSRAQHCVVYCQIAESIFVIIHFRTVPTSVP